MGHRHDEIEETLLGEHMSDKRMENIKDVLSNNVVAFPNGTKMATSDILSQTAKQKYMYAAVVKKHSHELDITQQIAKDLAYDIVYYVSNLKKLRPSSKHARTLRRTVDELTDKHQILFNGMVTKLQISEETGEEMFIHVADEMFRDKLINWGRLATLYALSGRFAKHCAEKNMVDFVDKIADFTGDYVAHHLGEWIHDQGGWDAFDDFFPEQPNVEGTLWRGLLCTVFGLGALATMAVVR